MFVVKITDLIPLKIDQQEISPELIPRCWVLKFLTKIHQVSIILGCKNDTNTPAILELWVQEVGPGLGQSGQRGGKMQASSQVLFIFKIVTTFDICRVRNMVFKSFLWPPYLQGKIHINVLVYILEYLHIWKDWSLVFLIFF